MVLTQNLALEYEPEYKIETRSQNVNQITKYEPDKKKIEPDHKMWTISQNMNQITKYEPDQIILHIFSILDPVSHFVMDLAGSTWGEKVPPASKKFYIKFCIEQISFYFSIKGVQTSF